MKKWLVYFAAGCLGALIGSLTLWFFGRQGYPRMIGVSMAPALSLDWLYPRIVWGGLWGLLFVLPILNAKLLAKGSVLSLVPSAVQIFVIYPFVAHKGMGGIRLGVFTPACILFINWVWGVATAVIIKLAK